MLAPGGRETQREKGSLVASKQGRRVVFSARNVVEVLSEQVGVDDLGPTEVVIQTHVTIISPGTELANLSDQMAMHTDRPRTYPIRTVGYANVGTVVASGDGLTLKPGDRVYSMGYHASIVRIDAQESFCVVVPESLTDEQAAFVRFANVSMTTLRTTMARAGDGVAVIGLGLVGNLAAQVFQAAGMVVRTLDRDPVRREIARRCGIGVVADPLTAQTWDRQHRLVIEATGSAEALVQGIALAQNGGEIVMIGAPWGGDSNSVPSSRITRPVFDRFLRLRSGSEWEIPRQSNPLIADSIHQNIETGFRWLQRGALQVQPLITHHVQPDGVPEAYIGLQQRPAEYLGVVVHWE